MNEPHQNENGGWYFWDECAVDEYGPFMTEDEAAEALRDYAAWLDTGVVPPESPLRALYGPS